MKAFRSILLIMPLLGWSSAQAAVVVTSATDASATASVSTDLLQTSLTSTTWQTNNNINNGTTGTIIESTATNPANITNNGSFDFVLNLTLSPLGFDISQINSYSGWGDARAGQSYSISFSVVGSATFTQITPSTVDVAAYNQSLVTSVFDDSSALLGTGVDVIRFTVGTQTLGNVWREIDVIGVATVPEATSAILLGLAGIGLICRRGREANQ